ncbi:MAG TPA: CGGC domain-containing protein [Spirochaetota bacterium]|nr:CGGC domain-containing protein [Spirochaetota bacterium]
MSKIAILTCANATQETNCSSTGCLRDMRERNGFFAKHPADEPLILIGMISCSGCPTLVAPEKILRKVAAVADYGIDTLHLSWCMTVLCPFISRYKKVINERYPDLNIIEGTHPEKTPEEVKKYREGVKEMLAPTVKKPQDMNDLIQRKFTFPAN